MNAHGIDRAVCFPFTMPSAFDSGAFADEHEVRLRPGRFPFDRENAALLWELERLDEGGRLLPFAMLDPAREVAFQLRSLERLSDRIAGLKTQTTIIESPIRALRAEGRDLMAFAGERDLPVLLHASIEPRAVWAQTPDCLAVAEAFPGVRFSLAHSLGFHREFLRRAAAMPNVWVDCAALLAHCRLAREDSPIIAARPMRVDVDYARPAEVVVAVHEILGERYLWGSDHPFMSWCDDDLRILYSYADEAAVLHSLTESVRVSMASAGPRAWLFGDRGGET